MRDDLIYCPNCKKRMPFMCVEKYVRKFELPKDESPEKVYVIQCEKCEYPIGVYPAKEGE